MRKVFFCSVVSRKGITFMVNEADTYKSAVGSAAAELVEKDMVIGLGTGSTAAFLVRALARRVLAGLSITGAVPTSQETAHLAASLGIPLVSLAEYPVLDLAIDGADEIDPRLNLIKGGGGALLREKIVATAARRFVVISDSSKLVPRLGTHFALPVEVVPFALSLVQRRLEELGAQVQPRVREQQLFITDNQNYILDCHFPDGISDPEKLQAQIRAIVGVVEHGLFLGIAQQALVVGPNGLQRLP
jgi:ribose 5-phosphate isomerase A